MLDLTRGLRDQVQDLIEARLENRRRAFIFKLAQAHAEEMLAKDKSASEIASVLSVHLGCPCCGPRWWRDIVVRAHKEEGIPLPPELQEA